MTTVELVEFCGITFRQRSEHKQPSPGRGGTQADAPGAGTEGTSDDLLEDDAGGKTCAVWLHLLTKCMVSDKRNKGIAVPGQDT